MPPCLNQRDSVYSSQLPPCCVGGAMPVPESELQKHRLTGQKGWISSPHARLAISFHPLRVASLVRKRPAPSRAGLTDQPWRL